MPSPRRVLARLVPLNVGHLDISIPHNSSQKKVVGMFPTASDNLFFYIYLRYNKVKGQKNVYRFYIH